MLLKYKMEAGPDADRSPDFEKHCFKGAQLFAKWSFVLVSSILPLSFGTNPNIS